MPRQLQGTTNEDNEQLSHEMAMPRIAIADSVCTYITSADQKTTTICSEVEKASTT